MEEEQLPYGLAQITDPGDTDLPIGYLVATEDMYYINQRMIAENKRIATGHHIEPSDISTLQRRAWLAQELTPLEQSIREELETEEAYLSQVAPQAGVEYQVEASDIPPNGGGSNPGDGAIGNPGDPTVAANLQLLRSDAEGELAAISQYERHILTLQDDPKAKHTLEHIEAEEKTHLAELSRLIAQRDPTQGAELEAKLAAIESHLNAIAASTLDMPLPELPGESVRDWLPSVSGSPGIVVDPGVARATPCIEIDLGKGRKSLAFSKGIVGALDEDQKSLYCQEGIEKRPATEKQQKRLAAMEAAAKLCSQEAPKGTTTEEHLKNYYGCLGQELRSKGVEPW